MPYVLVIIDTRNTYLHALKMTKKSYTTFMYIYCSTPSTHIVLHVGQRTINCRTVYCLNFLSRTRTDINNVEPWPAGIVLSCSTYMTRDLPVWSENSDDLNDFISWSITITRTSALNRYYGRCYTFGFMSTSTWIYYCRGRRP